MIRTFAGTVAIASFVAIAILAAWPAPERAMIASDGGPENSSKRHAWEHMRLRDPATGRIPYGIRSRELAFAATLPARDASTPLAKGLAAFNYDPQGPYNIGGRTRALALDVMDERVIIAGGVSGGIWRSTTGGEQWTRVTLPTQLPSVTTIVQDTRPGKTNTWYAGSGELLGNSASGGGAFYHGDGLLKSTDNGITWNPLANTASGTPHSFDKIFDNVWRIALDPSKTTEVLFAALLGTISRSTNGGNSWQQVLGGPVNGAYSYYTDVAVTTTGVAYATISSDTSRRGIYRTINGNLWTKILPPDMPVK
ncbi:MAG: flagellar basal body rod modification protein, partial [bacterium]|nr:flagellar basal body rod modification protein [Candidatus Kapabacteria bacterium]